MSLTLLALIAFAANSVLCRLALGKEVIDASSFTIVRLLSGIVVLLVLTASIRKKTLNSTKGSWTSAFMLFIYALSFSYAYISLDTGTGALILFGSVQVTMILISLKSGTRLHITEWIGVSLAFSGFVYLISPGVTSPSLNGFMLMTVAGIAWSIYTLQGRNSANPLLDTNYNFLRTTPLLILLAIYTVNSGFYSTEGLLLAIVSGGFTSAIGYTIWYIALGGLSSTQAAVLQLAVPVIAALGGVMFVSEAITLRLTLSSVMVLGGILMVISGKYYFTRIHG